MSAPDPSAKFTSLVVFSVSANYWWRKNSTPGVLLNNLMILFVIVPIGLVFKSQLGLSLIVFAFMIPYGFWVRRMAVSAVRKHLAEHPEDVEEFRNGGIIA